MTHFNTARINEMLGLQLGVIKNIALKLDGDNLENLEQQLAEISDAVSETRSMVSGLPRRHTA